MQLVAAFGLLAWISGSWASIKPGSNIECFSDLAWCIWCGPLSKGTAVRNNCLDFCNQCDVEFKRKTQPDARPAPAPAEVPAPAPPPPPPPPGPAPLIPPPATPAPAPPAVPAPPPPAVPAPPPSGKQPPTDAEADQQLNDCCVQNGVHPNCQRLCKYGVTVGEVQAATLGGGGCPLQADKFNQFLSCASQGHDNTGCCGGKGISGVCTQFCQATVNIQTFDTRYLACAAQLESVMKCHRDGLNNV